MGAREKRRAERIVDGGTPAWRFIWAQLKASGWTHKLPPASSIETRWKFIPPGGNATGVKGTDYFLGEDRVLAHYAAVQSTAAAHALSSACTAKAPVSSTEGAESTVAVGDGESSNADTPVPTSPPPATPSSTGPSPPTSQAVNSTNEGVESGNDISSEDSEEDAYDLVPRRSQTHQPRPTVISPQGASLFGSSDEDDSGGEATVHDDVGDGPNYASEASSIMSSDSEDDLNTIEEGENRDDFGGFESGDEVEMDGIEDEDDTEDEDGGGTATIELDAEGEESGSEEEDPNSTDSIAERHFAEKFLESLGGSDKLLAGAGMRKQDLQNLRLHSTTGWTEPKTPDVYEFLQTPYQATGEEDSYPELRKEPFGPTPDAMKCGDSPLALFFYFMPVALWQHIAVCSNNYKHEQLEARVEAYVERRKHMQRRRPEDKTPVRTRGDMRMSLMAVKPIVPHELCVFIGLLLARTVQPNREKISNHWKRSDEGAIPRGNFTHFLKRDRFMEISRNLHFSSNLDPRAKTDRVWKIRKGVHVLQRTFRRGFIPPAELAFGEAMLPSRSSFNRTRVYMKDKPCKWGTKLFMLCCARTAYCIRFEVYVGKKQHIDDAPSVDKKSGPAAVVRNLKAAFPEGQDKGFRLVVTDRFYTSVVLAIQLLLMGFYTVGTIMTNRIGYATSIKEKKKNKKKRPKDIMRGSFTYVRSKQVKQMAAIKWWDSKPVFFLCTGSDLALERVARREKTGEQHEVPCPKAVKDYHKYMGGVDVHDQLRLQRYSLQRAVTFRKYYKSLFLGLVDLAIVNGYIIHRAYHGANGTRPLTHVQYIRKLHLELIHLKDADMYEGNTFGADPPPPPITTDTPAQATTALDEGAATERVIHSAKQVGEWRNHSGQLKRVQRNCKVCSLLRSDGKRGGTTTYFCDACFSGMPVYLCMKPKHTMDEELRSCWDIWHNKFQNGTDIPDNLQGKIRLRQSPAKRRRALSQEEKVAE